jgi:hypothetical protein
MSTFYRNIRENLKNNNIREILNSKFGGNPLFLREAEKIEETRNANFKKMKKISNILSAINVAENGSIESKTTNIDLKNKEISLFYPIESPNMLAYSLTEIGYRKVFSTSIANILNRNLSNDRSKHGAYDDRVKKITKFINNFIGNYRLTVNNIQKNESNGIVQFDTTQLDPTFGTCKQYISVILNKDAKFSINDIEDKVGGFSKDYRAMFSYFMLFGFSNIYTRCTCKNYISKYSQKRGIANYMCQHVMYSMSMFPYYFTYVL